VELDRPSDRADASGATPFYVLTGYPDP
jgi:hypothetical protein